MGMSQISIHIPRVGDDEGFQINLYEKFISIHIPRVGDDDKPPKEWYNIYNISIHIPRVGDDAVA